MSDSNMKTDDIEMLLKKHFQQQHEYLDDDGFTANLMLLIPQKRNLSPWVKRIIFWVPVLLASAFALNQLPLLEIINAAVAFFITTSAKEFLLIAATGFLMVITYAGCTFMSESEG